MSCHDLASRREQDDGALLETGISLHQIQILLILTANPSDAPCCRSADIILSSSGPIMTMSGVLESC